MMGTSWHMKRWRSLRTDTARRNKRRRMCVDKITSLPNEMLSHIFSLLPTKDVAVAHISSKTMGHSLSLLTSLDLDDSHICGYGSHQAQQPVDRFPLFKSFVAKVLQSEAELPLTRFRLCFGVDRDTPDDISPGKCFPDMEPTLLNAWISFPFAHSGIRDLDLSFRIKNPDEYKLPSLLFDSPSLQFLRLDCNFRIHGADIPRVYLPNLKVMHIFSIVFTVSDFVSNLVSNCPALEDLVFHLCRWENIDCITISSQSLRRLKWNLTLAYEVDNDRVIIDTPNLQYLHIQADLPRHYSVTHMNALVEADIDIMDRRGGSADNCFWTHQSLLTAVSNAQHLYLHVPSLELVSLGDELKPKVPVPMFCNLRTLKLNGAPEGCWRWDGVLFLILDSVPLLETLVFPKGLFVDYDSPDRYPHIASDVASMEAESWRLNQILPSCRMPHLSRIEFGQCFGTDRELNTIKYFTGKASSLKEVVLCLVKGVDGDYPPTNIEDFTRKVEDLQRASNSWSIILHG